MAKATNDAPETTLARMSREVHEDVNEVGLAGIDIAVILAIIQAIMSLFAGCKKSASEVAGICAAQADDHWYLGFYRHQIMLDRLLAQHCPAQADLVRAALFDRAKTWNEATYRAALNEAVRMS